MRIVLCAGHHFNTPGKRCPDDSMREYAFNSAVVKYMIELLSAYPVEIITVHSDTRDVPLQERVQKANAWKADLYVSIHANASGTGWTDAQGIETFVYRASGEAFSLACEVQTQLIRETNRKNRSVKQAPFYVLKHTAMPAILCELGFMTNQEEATLLKSEVYRMKCAKSIVSGIVKVYKLQPKVVLKKALPIVQGLCTVRSGAFETEGILIDGISYVPARSLSELLGASVTWDGIQKVVTIQK